MSRRSFLVLIAIHIRTKISAPLRFINILAQTWDCTIFFYQDTKDTTNRDRSNKLPY
jgi:hypothetical protein